VLIAIGVLVAAADVASFAESYRGLYLWALAHGLAGVWAYGFPLMVDSFMLVGELALFVALADSWATSSRVGAWAVTALGLAASVAGNVGHVIVPELSYRLTAAVPPVATAAALAVGLGVLKRTVHRKPVSIWGQPGLYPAERPAVPASHPLAIAAGHHVPEPAGDLNGHGHAAAELFAADIEAGRVPGIRAIRSELHVGQDRATDVQAYLRTLTRTR
jgi:hypothetical protein